MNKGGRGVGGIGKKGHEDVDSIFTYLGYEHRGRHLNGGIKIEIRNESARTELKTERDRTNHIRRMNDSDLWDENEKGLGAWPVGDFNRVTRGKRDQEENCIVRGARGENTFRWPDRTGQFKTMAVTSVAIWCHRDPKIGGVFYPR